MFVHTGSVEYCFPLKEPLSHALASERHEEQNMIQIFTDHVTTDATT